MGLKRWLSSKVIQWLGSAASPAIILRAQRDPEFAEMLLRSNDAIWNDALTTHLMEKTGDITARGEAVQRQTHPYPGYAYPKHTATLGVSGTVQKPTPANLRRFSEYPPVRRAMNAISGIVLDMPWVIEKTPVLGSQTTEASVPSRADRRQIRILTNMFQSPNHSDSWRLLLSQVLEDILVGGFGCVEVVETGNDLRPAALFPVDGNSVRINLNWDGDEEQPRYAQSPGFVHNQHSSVVQQLLDRELMYIRLQARSSTPFGLGYVETAYNITSAWVSAFRYAQRRAGNATPRYMVNLGEMVDPGSVRRFRQYWNDDVEGQGRIPIIGGGKAPSILSLSQGGEDELWLKWQELLVRYVGMSFNLSAKAMSMERDVNRSTAGQLDADDWDAVAPVVYAISDHITHFLLHKVLGLHKYRFRFIFRDTDDMRQAKILFEQYRMNAVTPNEVREIYDRPHYDNDIGNWTYDQLRQYSEATRDSEDEDQEDLLTSIQEIIANQAAINRGETLSL